MKLDLHPWSQAMAFPLNSSVPSRIAVWRSCCHWSRRFPTTAYALGKWQGWRGTTIENMQNSLLVAIWWVYIYIYYHIIILHIIDIYLYTNLNQLPNFELCRSQVIHSFHRPCLARDGHPGPPQVSTKMIWCPKDRAHQIQAPWFLKIHSDWPNSWPGVQTYLY